MADWNLPTLASYEVDVLDELKSRDESLAKMFDGTTDSNIPIDAVKLSSVSLVGTFSKYNGTTWDTIVIADTSLPISSTDNKGIVELATSDETITGTDTTRAITPAGLSAKTASTSRAGIVQLNDSVTSTSTTQALTANQGKNLNDSITSLNSSVNDLDARLDTVEGIFYDTGWLSASSYSPLISTGNIRIARSGNIVTVQYRSITLNQTVSGAITIADVLPSWANTGTYYFSNLSMINSSGTTVLLYVQADNISLIRYDSNFAAVATSVFPDTGSVTYCID